MAPPSSPHLVRALERHLNSSSLSKHTPKYTLESFFPHLYPNEQGGIRDQVLSFVFDRMTNEGAGDLGYPAAQCLIDACNCFGSSISQKEIHPFSLRDQGERELRPLLEWFDAFFLKGSPTRPYAPFLYSEAWSRGERFWWDNLLRGMSADVDSHGCDFIFSYFGRRFGQAISELHVTDLEAKKLSVGTHERLHAAFSRVDASCWNHPDFWSAMVPKLPHEPYFLNHVLGRPLPQKQPYPSPAVRAWLLATSKHVDGSTLLNVVRFSEGDFSSWAPAFSAYPELLCLGERMISARSPHSAPRSDLEKLGRGVASFERAVLGGKHAPSPSLSSKPAL